MAGNMEPGIAFKVEFPGLGETAKEQQEEDFPDRRLFQGILEANVKEGSDHWRSFRSLRWRDQLNRFYSSQELSLEELQLRWQCYVDILTILRTAFPNCDASVLGSLLPGLGGDADSDIDIDIDPYGDNSHTFQGKKMKVIRSVWSKIYQTLEQAPSSLPLVPFVAKMQMVEGRIQLIRFRLSEHNLLVDLSVGNRMSVRRTELVQFYLDYDHRVKHLILFLRYWGKFHGVVGHDKVTPYAINLLVILYLSQEKIVPSVILLLTLEDIRMANLKITRNLAIQGWDSSLCTDLELINKHFKPSVKRNSQYSVNKVQRYFHLLQGFFKMLKDILSQSVVACPQLGAVLTKLSFRADAKKILNTLPNTQLKKMREQQWQLRRGKKFCSSLNIQDVFQLDFNLGENLSPEAAKTVERACDATLRILDRGRRSLLEVFVREGELVSQVAESPWVTPQRNIQTELPVAPNKTAPTGGPFGGKKSGSGNKIPSKITAKNNSEHPFCNCPGAPMENSRLARQMHPEIRSRIEFPCPGRITKGELITRLDESLSGILFRGILEGSVTESCGTWRYFEHNLSWDDQLDYFFSFQEVSPEELQLRWQVCVDILAILRSVFPDCDASAFGSVLTGLPESDADHFIHIDFDPGCDNGKIQEQVIDVLKKASSPHLSGLFVTDIVPRGNRNLKLKLSRINLKVDLFRGTRNRLAFHHSNLLQFYLNYDPRVKHLILFLQYWTSFHGLSIMTMRSQFALSMLVVVYLAQKKIVPSVILLQTLADFKREPTLEGIEDNPEIWDTSFCTEHELINKYFKPAGHHLTKEHYSGNMVHCFLDLIAGFFKMIVETDLPSVVFCPQLGKIVPKSDLSSAGLRGLERLPVTPMTEWRAAKWERDLSKQFTRPFSIQDPFVLELNLTGLTEFSKVETLDTLVAAARRTLEILESGPASLLELFVRDADVCTISVKQVKPRVVQHLKITTANGICVETSLKTMENREGATDKTPVKERVIEARKEPDLLLPPKLTPAPAISSQTITKQAKAKPTKSAKKRAKQERSKVTTSKSAVIGGLCPPAPPRNIFSNAPNIYTVLPFYHAVPPSQSQPPTTSIPHEDINLESSAAEVSPEVLKNGAEERYNSFVN